MTNSINFPTEETFIIVTLDQLRPYEHNPRLTKNPKYDELKASIRARHLDEPPPITRRPNADHYIIRNGGNTRLTILNELWAETRDKKFYEFGCQFKPWTNDFDVLTGHLVENELRGELSFIERALAINKTRELLEQENNKSISQSQLAQFLSQQGYPISQSKISRMQETINILLPAIPTALYSGLGIKQIGLLINLKNAGWRTWNKFINSNTQNVLESDFIATYQELLSLLDGSELNLERIQDELIGYLSQTLGVNYELIALEMSESRSIQNAINQKPSILSADPITDKTKSVSLPVESIPTIIQPELEPETQPILEDSKTELDEAENTCQ